MGSILYVSLTSACDCNRWLSALKPWLYALNRWL